MPPPIPPHETALAELDALAREREALIAAGAYQDYYLRLTEIAKRYLGARFGFEALDRTTEEIQDLLTRGQVKVEPLDPKAVITFLQDCDLVKFARLAPPEEETRDALQLVRDMVDRTKSVAAEPAAPTTATPSAEAAREPGDPEQARATRPEPQPPEGGEPPQPPESGVSP